MANFIQSFVHEPHSIISNEETFLQEQVLYHNVEVFHDENREFRFLILGFQFINIVEVGTFNY